MLKEQTNDTVMVLLYCDDEIRNNAWARVLLNAGASSIYVYRRTPLGVSYTQETVNEGGRPIAYEDFPSHATLALVHEGDRDLLEDATRADYTFWFNSSGSPRGSADEHSQNIYRVVSGAHFEISEDDARELVAFTSGQLSDLPECCQKRKKAHEIIPALAILCQGYLAVLTDAKGNINAAVDEGDIEIVKKALSDMGWFSFIKENNKLAPHQRISVEKLTDKRSQVIQPSWWGAPFGHRRPDDAEVKDETGKKPSGNITALLNAVFETNGATKSDSSATRIAPGVVARAYFEIADILAVQR